jgi:Uma2 family endonuclease
MVSHSIRRGVTAAQLSTLLALPENHHRDFELIDGELIEMSPAGMLASLVTNLIAHHLTLHVMAGSLGYITSAEGGYMLSEQTIVAPDIGFIARDRMRVFGNDFFPGAPDMAVEVLSKTDSKRKLRQKAELYLASGTQRVWLVFPEERTIEIYTGNEDVITIGQDGTLDGGDTLPGLLLPVRDCFPA